jgi:LacI family transcriptional regulator
MPVTMKDIARDLGVSVVTVSKVLRNHEDIGERTRKRVLDRVKELNYRPNLAARGLVTGHTYLVGLVVPGLLHPFFAEVAKALSKALLKKGYYLIISSSEEDPELEEREIDQLLGRRLDALVIATSCATPEIFERLEQQGGPPYVLIDRRFNGLATNFVGVDDEMAGAIATEHLVAVGCRRIAHLRGPDNSPGMGRLQGYREALLKHRLKALPGYVSASRGGDVHSRESGVAAMRELLQLQPRPDGVFCYNDPTAMGAIDAILDAGLRVPQDIAVIGCGNLHYNDSLRVPLSSIDQNTQQIGERAARLTLALLDAKTPPRRKSIIIQPSLAIRASSQKSTPSQKTKA